MMIRLDSALAPAGPACALLVSTQYLENYAWDENGNLDTDNPYWKAKGGSDYLVTSASLDMDSTELEQLIVLDRVRDEIEVSNGACREYVIGYRLVPADFDPAADVVAADDHYGYADFLRSSLKRLTA